MDDSPVKNEEGVDRKGTGYKSWKKKYRKMRIVFDQKMHHGEELHKQEAKASSTVKRLAIENDRLLDLLLDVNNSPQIPIERRIDLSLPITPDSKALPLQIDRDHTLEQDKTLKQFEALLNDVPHSSYDVVKDSDPSFVADVVASEGESHPANFLTPDDIDSYIHLIDSSIGHDANFPTLVTSAHPNSNLPTNPHLKNPTSVTNWLRKHAPKIFLQDGEAHGDGDDGDVGHTASGRKSRGGKGERSSKGERGNKSERGGKSSNRGKRASAAARLATERGDVDASMDDEAEFGATPVGRGKRKRDDDGGYRPRGSSSRPTKKKRKSEGDGTPSARRSKKDAAAANRDD